MISERVKRSKVKLWSMLSTQLFVLIKFLYIFYEKLIEWIVDLKTRLFLPPGFAGVTWINWWLWIKSLAYYSKIFLNSCLNRFNWNSANRNKKLWKLWNDIMETKRDYTVSAFLLSAWRNYLQHATKIQICSVPMSMENVSWC